MEQSNDYKPSDYLQERYKHYLIYFNEKSVFELVNTFNRETTSRGWVGERGAFLEALKDAFRQKKVDISSVATQRTFSLRYPVYLENRDGNLKLIVIS